MTFYETMYKIFAAPVKWLYRIKAVGTENIPEGGCIIAANHTAFSDVLVISAAAKRQVRYMAKAELFKTPLKPLITALGAYPVSRGGADVGSTSRRERAPPCESRVHSLVAHGPAGFLSSAAVQV